MRVRLTDFFRQELVGMGEDPEAFIREFSGWKAMGASGAHNHRYYGKDGLYRTPLVDGQRVLYHVHLEPHDESQYFADWDAAWSRKGHGKRVSNTVLIYAFDLNHGYLLLTILWEPDAHDIADMLTPQDRQLMTDLASVAAQFIFAGTCIV